MVKSNKKIGVVIVNYKKNKQLISLINELHNQTIENDICLIIVDNFVTYRTFEYNSNPNHKNIIFINPGKNIGYSVGVNTGVSAAISLGADYILILSPDVGLLTTDKLYMIYKEYQNIGSECLLGVVQKNPDNSFEPVGRTFPNPLAQFARKNIFLSKFLKKFLIHYINKYDCTPLEHANLKVEWLQSSLLFFSKSVWLKLNGMDTRYFVFMADVDLCLRARRKGIPSIVSRSIVVSADGVRAGGPSFIDIFRSKAGRIHIYDALKYYINQLINLNSSK